MPNKAQSDAEGWKEKRSRRPDSPKSRHGRRPECLPTEDAKRYDAVEAEFYESLKPAFPEERCYVDDIVYCIWMLRRLDRTQVELYTYVHEHAGTIHPDFPLSQPLAENPRAFNALMWRYISLRKALKEAFAGFHDLRANPFPLPPPRPAAETIQTPLSEIGFEFSTHVDPAPEPAHDTLSDAPPSDPPSEVMSKPMSKPRPKSDSIVARRWFISGRVQGVGYRNFAQSEAVEIGVTGYARNLPDGRVEVYAVGPPHLLSAFAARLHTGPRWSEVRTVEEQEDAVTEYDGFYIR